MDNWIIGREGEKIIRDWLVKYKIHFMQADILAKLKGGWSIFEIKHQEMFVKPPFDGHGLPKWQIEARLKFQQETNIRALLFIIDKDTEVIYWQYMDELIKGKSYQTKGNKPRVIFPLESYKIWERK